MTEPTMSAIDCASLFLRTVPSVMRRLGEAVRQQRGTREGYLNMGQVIGRLQIMTSLSSRRSSLRELAATHHVTPSTMSRAVDVLVQRGWVNRVNDTSDRRQIMLELTGEGQAALTAFRELMQKALAGILDEMSGEERGMLCRGLAALAALTSQREE